MWTLSSELQVLISSACLIAASDTGIDHSLNCVLGGISPSPWTALQSPFHPSPFICWRWHYMQRRPLSKIHLFNHLSSRRRAKGCTSVLGWVAEMPNISQHRQPLTKKNRLAFGTYIWPSHWGWTADYSGGKAWLKQPSCHWGWILRKTLTLTGHAKACIRLLFSVILSRN